MDEASSKKIRAWFAAQRERRMGSSSTEPLSFALSTNDIFALPAIGGPALGVDFVEARQPHVLVDIGPFVDGKKSLRIEQKMSERGIGAVVWNCGRTLCSLMHRLPECRDGRFAPGLRILELGCGTGVVGLACALRGASVTMTDLPENLDLARANAEANKVSSGVVVQALSWGSPTTSTFDVVIGSDCLYDADVLPALLKTLIAVTHSKSVVYLAYKRRIDDRERPFFDEASLSFKNVLFSDASETPEQWRGSGLHICRLSEKKTVVAAA